MLRTLLILVAESACLLGSSGPGGAMEGVEVTELPGADSQLVQHHVALLLPVQLLHVLVRTHAELSTPMITNQIYQLVVSKLFSTKVISEQAKNMQAFVLQFPDREVNRSPLWARGTTYYIKDVVNTRFE